MIFWIFAFLLTVAAAAFVLLPLMRKGGDDAAVGNHDVEVYCDQLEELARDQKSGLIGGQDAEFARAEVARRLLAAAGKTGGDMRGGSRPGIRRFALIFVILCLPAIAVPLYLRTGSPDLPDQPLAARLANPGDDMNILIARAEQHLVTNPGDGAGWDLLAPIYFRQGRMDEARNAYGKAIALVGPTPERFGGLAESIIGLSGGVVNLDAQEALRQTLLLKPDDPRAEFYLALALEQENRTAEALAAFDKLAAQSPKDAPWLPLVKQHIAMLTAADKGVADGKALGNPDAEAVAAAETMAAGDRQAMIRGMVDSLSARLKTDPANFEGWMRLVRSYAVLDEKVQAGDALKAGLKAFPAESDEGRQLLALGQELGLDAAIGGATP